MSRVILAMINFGAGAIEGRNGGLRRARKKTVFVFGVAAAGTLRGVARMLRESMLMSWIFLRYSGRL